MFERYTESGRRALFFARYEATQLAGTAIETEHLLLALIREPGPLVGSILVDADVSFDALRSEIEATTAGRPKIPRSVEMPFSAETGRALRYAAEEADALAHRHIGPEHLLLGLLRERGASAERHLARKGLSLDRVRQAIREREASPEHSSASHPSRSDALGALERVSSFLSQLRHDNADVPDLVERIELELELVRRALNA